MLLLDKGSALLRGSCLESDEGRGVYCFEDPEGFMSGLHKSHTGVSPVWVS